MILECLFDHIHESVIFDHDKITCQFLLGTGVVAIAMLPLGLHDDHELLVERLLVLGVDLGGAVEVEDAVEDEVVEDEAHGGGPVEEEPRG